MRPRVVWVPVAIILMVIIMIIMVMVMVEMVIIIKGLSVMERVLRKRL